MKSKERSRSGRFSSPSSELLRAFNASLGFDRRLFGEDIQGSLAHLAMLAQQGIIAAADAEQIRAGLEGIRGEIEAGEFDFDPAAEDIHMAIEGRLGELSGEDLAGRLHTARSRNDQVATDFKLFVKKASQDLSSALKKLIHQLITLARAHKFTLMPSFTHLQHAQVVSFGFHMAAYGFMFERDLRRLKNFISLHDTCPLGAAACAGTSYGIDRRASAAALGFASPAPNAMDAVSERDFALDLLYAICLIFTHASRLCEELIIFSSAEFGFVEFSEAYSTGSSIMPQKKNPDAAELIRGKTGRVHGHLLALLTTMKALPLAYNKDMQEDKEAVFDSVDTALMSLEILTAMLGELKINEAAMRAACARGHLGATDLADFLVRERGLAFRRAHFIVGELVALAERRGVDLSELKDLASLNPLFDEAAVALLDPENSLKAKKSEGGASPERVEEQLGILERAVED